MTWAINAKIGWLTVPASHLACIESLPNWGQKVKVTGFSNALLRGYAGRYDCLGVLSVISHFCGFVITWTVVINRLISFQCSILLYNAHWARPTPQCWWWLEARRKTANSLANPDGTSCMSMYVSRIGQSWLPLLSGQESCWREGCLITQKSTWITMRYDYQHHLASVLMNSSLIVFCLFVPLNI